MKVLVDPLRIILKIKLRGYKKINYKLVLKFMMKSRVVGLDELRALVGFRGSLWRFFFPRGRSIGRKKGTLYFFYKLFTTKMAARNCKVKATAVKEWKSSRNPNHFLFKLGFLGHKL